MSSGAPASGPKMVPSQGGAFGLGAASADGLNLGTRPQHVIDKFYKNRPTLEQAQEALKRLTGEGALSKEEEEANRKYMEELDKRRALALKGTKRKSKSKKDKKDKKDKKAKKDKKKKKKKAKAKEHAGPSLPSASDTESDDTDSEDEEEYRERKKRRKKDKTERGERMETEGGGGGAVDDPLDQKDASEVSAPKED